jgi:hypothetical protein
MRRFAVVAQQVVGIVLEAHGCAAVGAVHWEDDRQERPR